MSTAPAGTGSWLRDLARSAAGPLICAVILIGLLSAWVATGGAGTVSRVRIQVTLAAVPMRGFTAAIAARAKTAGTYVTIENLTGTPDELISVSSPDARQVVLTSSTGLVVPAHGTLVLSPLGHDAVLVDPVPFESRGSVPLTLVFRNAGQITVNATVTAPGTP